MKNDQTQKKTFEIKSNCGSVIISAANVVKWILIILALLFSGGIAVAVSDLSVIIGIAVGLVLFIINLFLAIVLADLLRGYGEIVENSAINASALLFYLKMNNIKLVESKGNAIGEKKLTEQCDVEEAEKESVTVDEDGVHFHGVRDAQVKCPFCDYLQPNGTKFCAHCGQKFFYD